MAITNEINLSYRKWDTIFLFYCFIFLSLTSQHMEELVRSFETLLFLDLIRCKLNSAGDPQSFRKKISGFKMLIIFLIFSFYWIWELGLLNALHCQSASIALFRSNNEKILFPSNCCKEIWVQILTDENEADAFLTEVRNPHLKFCLLQNSILNKYSSGWQFISHVVG